MKVVSSSKSSQFLSNLNKLTKRNPIKNGIEWLLVYQSLKQSSISYYDSDKVSLVTASIPLSYYRLEPHRPMSYNKRLSNRVIHESCAYLFFNSKIQVNFPFHQKVSDIHESLVFEFSQVWNLESEHLDLDSRVWKNVNSQSRS